jgi:hypothetical protein
VDDIGGAFRKAATGTSNVKLRMVADDATCDLPVMYSFSESGAAQMACAFVLNFPSIGYIDSKCNIQFTAGATSVDLFVQAELISA